TGSANTAVGAFVLAARDPGSQNTAAGQGALRNNIAGGNVGVVDPVLYHNTDGGGNTATGYQALYHNTDDGYLNNNHFNTANGYQALFSNNGGGANTATGSNALYHNTTGYNNTGLGFQALYNNTTGGQYPDSGNTAIGYDALYYNTTGSSNIELGDLAGRNVITANGVICIGADGANVSNGCYIGHISGADATGGDPVFITSEGKLGTVNPLSSARFKEDINPMNEASEAILALKPVTFRYKREFDPKRTPQFGLVAEEVEKVNPDLVKRDRDGKLQTVRYEAVNAMLLNEFLKEHRTVQELKSTVAKQEAAAARQEAIIAKQQKQIETLTTGLQKVRDQLKLSGSAPRTVADNR